MPDLSLSVLVTRNQLGLDALQINDHDNYYLGGEQFLSTQVAWQRNQVTSPFTDGAVTITRNMQIVNESLTVEVLGDNMANLYDNINVILAAFKQDYFRFNITNNGQYISYQCEAADYTVQWNGPRFVAHQVQVQFNMPRQPAQRYGDF